MQIDPYILTFSALTVIATIWMGFWSAKKSKTASDFFVAGRSVSVGWNASAISGEYLSAASFMGVAGMVMSSGYDALWYPVCYACGYLFLLLFIAGPLRRFGAYTIPDFAEGRFDSPVFRKIAVVFVLFIGFFYTMPQMKGAGTTLAYIFPGLPYWAGVVLVGAVITLNVALGGMKGITLVQAFQYWLKMFAISVPVFVLMTVYGHYGAQLRIQEQFKSEPEVRTMVRLPDFNVPFEAVNGFVPFRSFGDSGMGQFGAKGLSLSELRIRAETLVSPPKPSSATEGSGLMTAITEYARLIGETIWFHADLDLRRQGMFAYNPTNRQATIRNIEQFLNTQGLAIERDYRFGVRIAPAEVFLAIKSSRQLDSTNGPVSRTPLPPKAPSDTTWLNPFGPLTTKAAKAAAATLTNNARFVGSIPLRADLAPETKMTVNMGETNLTQALATYAELTGRTLVPCNTGLLGRIDDFFGGRLSRWNLVKPATKTPSGVFYHRDGLLSAIEVKERLETLLKTNAIVVVPEGAKYFRAINAAELGEKDGSPMAAVQKSWLRSHEKPLALLYTYSLIIALVCGTAGLPHILVRFYTNPDGVAAKRTTMWVMILIGVFYLFPPVFGVMGRNLLPDLYAGTGAKGTDKVVLELPRILNERQSTNSQFSILNSQSPSASANGSLRIENLELKIENSTKGIPWGSILSGITCAGAFAAFMSTFSGLLVSLTGALAHDVYGRMLNPKSTPDQRMRMFKVCAVLCGGGAILLGFLVEKFEINKMVGWAFAIAATSYFPLLFLSTWWRGVTMKGAATGMLAGGTLSLLAIASTMFADQALWAKGLADFYAGHPLLRILAEQPAIWALPLALALMFFVSKVTRAEVPSDIRMKMLVLHAPEKLGLKQEYIQEHQPGH